MAELTLRAPFPWFGGKNYGGAWMGQVQFRGWRPVRFVVLLVDHRCSRRASTQEATARSWYSSRCSSRCAALLTSSRLSISSFNGSRSLWWMPIPRGMGPWTSSQLQRARKIQTFGSATLTNALRTPPRPCLVRMRTEPTGKRLSAGTPAMNRPSLSLIGNTIGRNYAHVN